MLYRGGVIRGVGGAGKDFVEAFVEVDGAAEEQVRASGDCGDDGALVVTVVDSDFDNGRLVHGAFDEGRACPALPVDLVEGVVVPIGAAFVDALLTAVSGGVIPPGEFLDEGVGVVGEGAAFEFGPAVVAEGVGLGIVY